MVKIGLKIFGICLKLKQGPKQDFFQPITPSDRNCMFHSLADQLVRLDPGTPYNCHKSVRSAVVFNLLELLETERIIWINEDEPIEDWLDRMREFGEFGEEYCLQIF